MTTSTGASTAVPGNDRARLDRRLQVILEDTLVSSPNVQELHPTPLAAYQARLVTTDPNIAELFHANSRLAPPSIANQPLRPDQHEAVRAWVAETAFGPSADDIDVPEAQRLGVYRPLTSLPYPLHGLLSAAASCEELIAALYAVDLWLLVDSDLFRHPNGAGGIWLERSLTAGDLTRLDQAVLNLAPTADARLFLVAAPWRYMLFQGPRGYRRCLVDAGKALTVLRGLCMDLGLNLDESLDFYDDRVNQALDLDGVERAVIAAATVGSRVTP